MSNRIWVGVDVSKQGFHAALAWATDRPTDWARVPVASFSQGARGHKAFVQWVRAQAGRSEVDGVCVESTGRLGWAFLEQVGLGLGPVAMVNPARTKRFGESLGLRDKTDRVDACVLALYGVIMQPRPTELPAAAVRELRECNRLFSELSASKQAYALRLEDGPSSAAVRGELKRTIAGLERRMKALQARMDALIAQEQRLREDVERITTIKGVGRRTAYVLLAELGDLRRFSRNELVAYAGLFPRQVQSGTSVHKRPRLAKQGGQRIRKVLYLCAMSARRHNPQMQRFYQHLIDQGKAPMAALGALMRKLLLLARSVLVNQTVYNPLHA